MRQSTTPVWLWHSKKRNITFILKKHTGIPETRNHESTGQSQDMCATQKLPEEWQRWALNAPQHQSEYNSEMESGRWWARPVSSRRRGQICLSTMIASDRVLPRNDIISQQTESSSRQCLHTSLTYISQLAHIPTWICCLECITTPVPITVIE